MELCLQIRMGDTGGRCITIILVWGGIGIFFLLIFVALLLFYFISQAIVRLASSLLQNNFFFGIGYRPDCTGAGYIHVRMPDGPSHTYRTPDIFIKYLASNLNLNSSFFLSLALRLPCPPTSDMLSTIFSLNLNKLISSP